LTTKREIVISLGISKRIYEAILNQVHENKLFNLKKGLKGENKKPDTMNAIIRNILEEKLLK